MKAFIYILIAIAAGLLIYNITYIDFQDPLSGDSSTAVVGILASVIVILLMLILLVSRAIAKKVDANEE